MVQKKTFLGFLKPRNFLNRKLWLLKKMWIFREKDSINFFFNFSKTFPLNQFIFFLDHPVYKQKKIYEWPLLKMKRSQLSILCFKPNFWLNKFLPRILSFSYFDSSRLSIRTQVKVVIRSEGLKVKKSQTFSIT